MANDPVTLVDLVAEYFGQKTTYPLHRLDRGTSGAIVFAKHSECAAKLQDALQRRVLKRTYHALVRGVIVESLLVDHPVPGREGGARVEAQTDFRRLDFWRCEPRAVSLVEACPQTGRFHQIRRHLKHINHPILGDSNYGKGALNREFCERYGLCRLALHAARVQLPHPYTSVALDVVCALPDDLAQPLERLQKSCLIAE